MLANHIEYTGSDLFQNEEKSVDYVGDIMSIELEKRFDCVVGLDVVEHVDDPAFILRRMYDLSNRYIIVSLPNIYHIRHKYNFAFKSSLGDKYSFQYDTPLDRHRWVMNYDEILLFYEEFSRVMSCRTTIETLTFSRMAQSRLTRFGWNLVGSVIGEKHVARSVFCLFEKA